MPKFSDLKFVQIYNFAVVPRYLLEQVEEIDEATIERIYEFGPLIATSPTTLLFVLVDVDYKIKGVLWAYINVIEAIIYVQLVSLDREYQSQDIIKEGTKFLFELPTGPELQKKIEMATFRPEAFEKAGWKRSEKIRMEITDVESNDESDSTGQKSEPDAEVVGQTTGEAQ